MKKMFTTIAAAAFCATTLSVQSIAENAFVIYAVDAQSIAERVNLTIPEDFGIKIKADTIMPVYSTSIYDYAKTGELDFEQNTYDGVQAYFADTENNDGKFAGTVMFTADGATPGILIEAPRDDESLAIDFNANANRIKRLMESKNLNADIKDAKYVFAEGLGYVYYISNGTDEAFVAANFKGTNGYYFTEENGGIVVVNSDLIEKVNAELSAQTGEGILSTGGNPSTGSDLSAYLPSDENPPTAGADNPPTAGTENPNTGYSGTVLMLGSAIVASSLVVSNRRKNRK